MARMVAFLGSIPKVSILRTAFSVTTMASSTTIPIARTIPNNDNVLMLNPKSPMTANVPMSETGMVAAGIRVALQS